MLCKTCILFANELDTERTLKSFLSFDDIQQWRFSSKITPAFSKSVLIDFKAKIAIRNSILIKSHRTKDVIYGTSMKMQIFEPPVQYLWDLPNNTTIEQKILQLIFLRNWIIDK